MPGFSMEAIRSAGIRMGNIETDATMGVEGRVGWNLPNDFGSYPIKPGAENRAPSAAAAAIHEAAASHDGASPPRGIHFFGMLDAKLVAYDFSLDGNLFQSSHSVTRRPWVAQAAGGISTQGILAGRGIRLAAMRVFTARGNSKSSGPSTLLAQLR